jgi:hypothetical protein
LGNYSRRFTDLSATTTRSVRKRNRSRIVVG